MKKLLIMLMVVAMASFLFVGCLPGVVTDVDVVEDEEPVVTPLVTVAPVIGYVEGVSLTSTAAQYVSKAEATGGIWVLGTAPTYSEVKVYIGPIVAGTADTLAGSTWSVLIDLSELGDDEAKTVHAVAKEPGKEESVKSNEVEFTLDQTLPTASVVVRVVEPAYFRVTFSEAVNVSAAINTTAIGPWPSALNPNNWAACGDPFIAYGTASVDFITLVSDKEILYSPVVADSPIAQPFVTPPVINLVYYVCVRSVEDEAGNAIAGATTTILTSARIYGVVLP